LKIPDDISLVSFDDQPYSGLLASPMTTVEQMKEEIAGRAVDLLLEMITDGSVPKEVEKRLIKPRLIIRNSVKKIQV
jgi:LacI family transcriptional regulator